MTTFVALLRAINVNGHNMIKMAELRRMFEQLGLGDVQTYIQSGNVLFRSSADEGPLRKQIEMAIQQTFGLTVSVILRTDRELHEAVKQCPFTREATNGAKLYVSLLADLPAQDVAASLAPSEGDVDDFRIIGRHVYILCGQSYHKSKYSNQFFERKLRVTATSRNWQTMTKLVEMVDAGANKQA